MNALQVNKQNLDSILRNIDKFKNQDIDCIEINLFDFVSLPLPGYFPDDTVSKKFEIERRKIDLNIENFGSAELKQLCEKLHSMNIKVLIRIINNEYLGDVLFSYMQRALITYNNRNILGKKSANNDEEYEYLRRLEEYSIFKTTDVECSNYINVEGKTLKEEVISWFKNSNGDKSILNLIFSKYKRSIFDMQNFEELKQNLISLIRRYSIEGFIFADDNGQNQSILCEELKSFIIENSLIGYQEVRRTLTETTYIPLHELPNGYIRLEEEPTKKDKVFCLKYIQS